jgi:hypothetical protein
LAGHSRTSSQQCLKHKASSGPAAATAAAVLQEQQQEDPVDSDADMAADLDGYEAETLEEHLQKHAASNADDDNDSRKNSNGNDEDSEVQLVHVL